MSDYGTSSSIKNLLPHFIDGQHKKTCNLLLLLDKKTTWSHRWRTTGASSFCLTGIFSRDHSSREFLNASARFRFHKKNVVRGEPIPQNGTKMYKKNNGTPTLARVWRQRCSCFHNCSEHNNRNCPVSGKITPVEVAGSSWGSVCVPGWDVSAAPAPAAAVGVAPAPAGLFQLPSHREPPQTTVRERCERHKRT